jgi:hypothetical protein
MTIYLNILKKNYMGSTSTYNMFSMQKGFIVSSKVMHSILGLRKKASYQTEKKITKSLYIGKQSGIQFTIFIKVLRLSLWNICVTNDHGYILLVVSTSQSFPHSWLITRFVTILTRRVPLVEQELFYPSGVPTFTSDF